MTHTMFLRTLLLLFVSSGVSAQVMTFPTAPGNSMGTATSMNLVQSTVMDHNLWMINSEMRSPRRVVMVPSLSLISRLQRKHVENMKRAISF